MRKRIWGDFREDIGQQTSGNDAGVVRDDIGLQTCGNNTAGVNQMRKRNSEILASNAQVGQESCKKFAKIGKNCKKLVKICKN